MTTVLLIVHLLVATALVAVILMQRSEGGALGIGGGPGGMMSGRGAANLLTRTTMILGGVFVANSILLAVVSGIDSTGQSVFDEDRGRGGAETTQDIFGDAFSDPDTDTPAVPDEDAPSLPDGQSGDQEGEGAPEDDQPSVPNL